MAAPRRRTVKLSNGTKPTLDPQHLALERARVAMLASRDRVAAAAIQWSAASAKHRSVRQLGLALREAVSVYRAACGEYDRAFAEVYGPELALRSAPAAS